MHPEEDSAFAEVRLTGLRFLKTCATTHRISRHLSGRCGCRGLLQVCEQIVAFALVLHTIERHPVTGDERLRILEEGVERIVGPDDVAALQGR
jgi:hypothetical protein